MLTINLFIQLWCGFLGLLNLVSSLKRYKQIVTGEVGNSVFNQLSVLVLLLCLVINSFLIYSVGELPPLAFK